MKVEILGQTDGIIKAFFPNGNVELGNYETIERALEVLDEIQDKFKVLFTNEAGAEFILARNLVPIIYEMPKD